MVSSSFPLFLDTPNWQQDRVNLSPLKCPRCHSNNTKFCYYNNHKFSQPRHKCKSCNRQWTSGGALRDIPEGGRRRKNKRSSQSATVSNPPVSDIGGGLFTGNTLGLNSGGNYRSMTMTAEIMSIMMMGNANSSDIVKMEADNNTQPGLNLENELLMEVFGSDANATSTMETNNIINNNNINSQFLGSINNDNNNNNNNYEITWKPPEVGVLKLNFHADISRDKSYGWGFVIRDHIGEVVLAGTQQGMGGSLPEIEEARACDFAVCHAARRGLSRVVIESDCLQFINKLKAKVQDNSFVGLNISHILSCLASFDFFSFSCVPRSANIVARELAHLEPISFAERIWEKDQVPDSINNLAATDLCKFLDQAMI